MKPWIYCTLMSALLCLISVKVGELRTRVDELELLCVKATINQQIMQGELKALTVEAAGSMKCRCGGAGKVAP